jgi:hypothetical protein
MPQVAKPTVGEQSVPVCKWCNHGVCWRCLCQGHIVSSSAILVVGFDFIYASDDFGFASAFRRLVFGEKKIFPLMIAILPTSVFALTTFYYLGLLIHETFPVQFSRFGPEVEGVVFCLYAHIVCASWWLSDKMGPRVP